ncbi:hypothetical protein BC834DRAFT_840991 [Gloeopeniophorella convolvens]|nr:hypothetical protein BC834DRAFT_840991 [Gloeopeniophorella convolvens]
MAQSSFKKDEATRVPLDLSPEELHRDSAVTRLASLGVWMLRLRLGFPRLAPERTARVTQGYAYVGRSSGSPPSRPPSPAQTMSQFSRATRHLLSRKSSSSPIVPGLSPEELCRAAERQLGISGLTVSFLTNDASDIEAATSLAVKTLSEQEPVTRQVVERNPTLARKGMVTFCTELLRQSLADGFTVIAKVDGDVVGLLLMAPYEPAPPANEAPPGVKPVYDILHRLGDQFDAYVATCKGKQDFVEIIIATIDRRFQGQQVIDSLLRPAVRKAELMGYTHVMTKATSYSQVIAKSLGFTTVGEVLYLTYEFNGERSFANLGPRDVKQAMVQVVGIATLLEPGSSLDVGRKRVIGAKL